MVQMQDQQQFEQLMLQYNQLKTGAELIKDLIEKEDFDSAMTMLKTRESMFLNCKCMRKFLELTPEQEKELNIVLDDLRALEMGNIKALEKNMEKVQQELKLTQQTEKIQQAYDFDENTRGNIINVTEQRKPNKIKAFTQPYTRRFLLLCVSRMAKTLLE